jgi:hypothetical protein
MALRKYCNVRVKHIAVGINVRHINNGKKCDCEWIEIVKNALVQVPPWVREESLDRLAGDSPDWTDRGTADGNSVQPDSDFGELLLNHNWVSGSESALLWI